MGRRHGAATGTGAVMSEAAVVVVGGGEAAAARNATAEKIVVGHATMNHPEVARLSNESPEVQREAIRATEARLAALLRAVSEDARRK